jgi:FkbM family methyltransferase
MNLIQRYGFRRLTESFRQRVLWRVFGTPEERFDDFGFRDARGVIHVGANSGQERDDYAERKLPVVWVEPLPDVFRALKENIAHHSDQRAFEYLISDTTGAPVEFHVSTGDGAASSMFELDKGRDMYPDLEFTPPLRLTAITFDDFVAKESIDLSKYDALVLDTQGAELLVLRGATLSPFRAIKVEAADFALYKGAAFLSEIEDYLRGNGFVRSLTKVGAQHPDGGAWYDVWFIREASEDERERNWWQAIK